MWRNEKKNFNEFLVNLNFAHKIKMKNFDTLNDLLIFSMTTVLINENIVLWMQNYEASFWFENIYAVLIKNSLNFSSAKLFKKSFNYKMMNDILWKHRKDFYFSCISERKIKMILEKIYDETSHWVKTETFAKFSNRYYWLK